MSVDPFTVRITWQAISPALRATVEGACTPRQVHVVMLRAAGYGSRESARHLGVDESSVREVFAAAARNIRRAYPRNPPIPEGGSIHDQR